MRDEEARGPLTPASAPFSGSPPNRQIPRGETAPGHPGRRRCKELPGPDTGLQSRDRSLEERDLVEGRAKDLVRIRAEVAAQDLLINGSEVDGELEVAC